MGSPRLWVGVTWLSICLPGDPPREGTLTVPSGGVCLCLCVYVGEVGHSSQQSRELETLYVTSSSPLEGQRKPQEHDLKPQEGEDFRDWGAVTPAWLSDPLSILLGEPEGLLSHGRRGFSIPFWLSASCRAGRPGFKFLLYHLLAVVLGQVT